MLQSRGWVCTYCICWHDLDLIQGQGQGHRPFELPTIAHNCTFLGLSPPPLSRGAQNWWLTVIVWDSTACRSPIFEFPFRKGITTAQTSRNVDISRHSNAHIFWYCMKLQSHGQLGTLVVLHVLCMLVWPWPDPRSKSTSRGFWTSDN